MPKMKDITGQKFGRLTAIRFLRKKSAKIYLWLFKCDCGNEKEINKHTVLVGNSRSCGCFRQELLQVRTDISGQKFGKLTAIKEVEDDEKGLSQWLFSCECGTKLILGKYSVSHPNNPRTNCGKCVSHTNKGTGRRYRDITGQRFGKLLAIKRLESVNEISKWFCKCDCGNEIEVFLSSLTNKKYPRINCSCDLLGFGALDIKGQKFGNLTAIKPTRKTKTQRYWLFKCDCGDEKEIPLGSIESKKHPTTSCGCKTKKHYKDVAGQKFGRLTAIKRTARKNNQTFWLFKCDCGNEKEIALHSVNCKKGKTKSCGCLNREIARKTLEINRHAPKTKISGHNLIGKKFGKIKVIKYAHNDKKNNKIWKCLCECGKEKFIASRFLVNGKSKSCGCNTYKKGKDNPLWKPGSKKDRRRLRKYKRLALEKAAQGKFTIKQWREKIKYYGNCCYLCGKKLNKSNTHLEHRIPISRGGTNWIANIAPACKKCNLSKHTKTEKEFREVMNQQ